MKVDYFFNIRIHSISGVDHSPGSTTILYFRYFDILQITYSTNPIDCPQFGQKPAMYRRIYQCFFHRRPDQGRPKHRYVKSGPYPKGFVPAPIYNVHSNLSESARHIPSGARTKHLLQKPNAYFYNLHQEPTTAPATKTASIYPYLNDQIHPGTILPGYNNVSLHAFLSRGQPKPAKLRKHNAR